MGRLALFCVTFVVFIGLTSGFGVLPEDFVNAAVGDSVQFNTSLAPAPTHLNSITWQFGGSTIVNSVAGGVSIPSAYINRTTLSTFTGSLELRNVALTDSGVYTVTIIPTLGGEQINGNINLTVYVPVSNVAVTAPSTDLVESNSSVSLSCSASGSSLSFLWINGSTEVTAGDRVQITDGGATLSTLTIDPVLRYDNEPYTCKVSNPVSSSTSGQILFSISYGPDAPIVTLTPGGGNYEEGSNVFLSCSADSRPEAQYEWFFNGATSSTGAQKNLVNIQKNQDGNYSCQAFNSKTLRYTTSEPVLISVLVPVSNVAVKPTGTDLVEFNSSVSLSCSASGSSLSFLWLKGNDEVTAGDRVQITDGGATLTISPVLRYDQGSYTCKVSNPVSSSTSGQISLSVSYGPDAPIVTLTPKGGKYKKGSEVSLSCSADSRPEAQYEWFFNGATSSTGAQKNFVKIQMNQGGNYSCQAFNSKTLRYTTSELVPITVWRFPIWLIVLIVLLCIAAVLLVSGGGFHVYKKKKSKENSNTRTDGEGRDNSAFTQNQEPNYADVRFVKRDGEVVQLGVQNNNTEYSEVKRDNKPPASRLPSYDAHMQRRPAPEPPTEYAEVRRK